jgi:hypothetical protein
MADLSASRVQQYLADLRENGRSLPPLDPDKDWFTRDELAATVKVKPATANTLVRRHGLEATGNGQAHRFPRSTAVALQERLGRGAGIQTANYYLREIKSRRAVIVDSANYDLDSAEYDSSVPSLFRRHSHPERVWPISLHRINHRPRRGTAARRRPSESPR